MIKKYCSNKTLQQKYRSIILRTAGGTSENGKVPVVFASKDEQIIQIEVDVKDFDGSILSYILVDG
ncbi:hypothetical protein [Inconstantimicrobium porci]|uniref:Uncharacterized protein n=1 Tax=Inconstantimicrobium porci TaxID=2652291 RepID=A0A7X2MXS2_9CLOT|nr:hypothetical protein [Inconstantimicrobium porci]MSR91024.1 hypothetical protein [Inconstantimicrobium porci]